MRKIFTILAALFFTASVWAQIPNKMSYQAIIRDNAKKLVCSQLVGMQVSILKDGSPIYVETHTTSTNANGLLTLEIGAGNVVSGKFAGIDWTNGSYSIKTEADPLGGTAYSITGTSQLLSVPFALMSNIALKSLNDMDTNATNELQMLKLSNDTLYLDRGGYVYLAGYNDKMEIQKLWNKLNTDSAYFDTKINIERAERQKNDSLLTQKIISDSNYLKGLSITNALAIGYETNSRIVGDQNLKTKQIADSSYLRTMINSTNSNLTTETNARITGDQNLKTKVVADSSYLKGLIVTETTNRISSDNTLQTNINNLKAKEASDSSMFAGALTTTITNLTTETNARIVGDQSLRTKIVADSTYLKGQINTTNTNLVTTNTNLATTNTNLATTNTNLTTETNNRIAGDNALRTKSVADSTYLKGQINTTNTNLATTNTNLATTNTNLTTETNNRISGDNSLRTKVVADSTYLKGQINTTNTNLTTTNTNLATTNTNLTTETNNRISGDNALRTKAVADSTYLKGQINTTNTNLATTNTNLATTNTNLATEITNRSNADNTLQTNINSLKTKVVADSSYLKGQINTTNSNLATTNNNLTTETNNRIAGDNALRTKVVADSTFLKAQINSTNTNLTNEISNRIDGDNIIKNKVIADSSYLKAQINSTNSNLATETTNRIVADQSLKTKIVADSTYLKTQINTTNTNLTNETINRIDGDNVIKNKVVADSAYLKGLINNKQTTLTAGAGITINSSNVIKATDSSATNEMQTISRSNDTIFLSNGGFVKLPASVGASTALTHNVGDLYQGGIIVSVWKTGTVEYGLICSMVDLSTGIIWTLGAYQATSVGASSDWNGQANTTAIVTQAGSGSTYAASLCDAYTNVDYGTGVYSDWYLPTIDQLNMLWDSKYLVNKALDSDGNSATTAITKNYYWSSTEYSSNGAWGFALNGGSAYTSIKNSTTYVRAFRSFASNTVSDISGNVYDTVNIGSQVWLKQNLKTTKYQNGDAIPNVTLAATWAGLSTGAYCDYANTPSNSTTYGKLYNWYSVNDSRKICPSGYHVPTDAEWTTLETYLGGSSVAGGKLKEAGLSHWASPNTGATNSSRFTALPGGGRGSGIFGGIGSGSYWWSSTEYSATEAWYRYMSYSTSDVYREYYPSKVLGYSVRCIKD